MNQSNNFSIARKELGFSQIKMAEILSITRETIGNTERGKNLNYQYLHFLMEKGFSKEWLEGNSSEKHISHLEGNSLGNEALIIKLKVEAEERVAKAEIKAEKSESRILQLERKIMEVQSEMNVIYKFLFKHSDKLDLSELELSLGKRKVSSKELAILSKSFDSHAAHA